MISQAMVELSRWQFAATSLYHFIFVPLTLGISWLIFIMELMYVRTGDVLYRDMTKFWGKLFGINFAIGVATGITLEFEFGTNWSNYSHYVGDIFGAPLAIEGLLAFFLESTFIGLFFTGWNRFSKKAHLAITFLTALGSNLSAMWILIANGWMQYPEFAVFSPEKMRMEMVDFFEELPEYDPSMYAHKKMKTTPQSALEVLQELLPLLEEQTDYGNDALYRLLLSYVEKKGCKNGYVLWPVRTAVSGKQMTPAGATEIMEVLGKEESLSRIDAAIAKLEGR